MNQKSTSLLLGVLALSFETAFGASLGTSFTYQGRLSNGAVNAANGFYDLTFSVWSAATGAPQVGNTLTNTAVGVTNGLFTVSLDFGASVFDGNARWLELGVRTNSNTAFVTLGPRQSLAATPYAQYAAGAGTASAVPAGAITTAMLANGAVTSAKIGAGAVKPSNLDDGGDAVYQQFLAAAAAMDNAAPLPTSALSLVSSNSGVAPSFSFTLDAGGFGTVVSFTGHEAISEPYTYVVEAIAAPGLLDANAQIGRQGRLIFARNGRSTVFAGLVTACSASSFDGTNDLYTFRLEAPLAYLALNTDYKIYQNLSLPDVLASNYSNVSGYALSKSLTGTYLPLPNTTQFGETAFNFFSRLVENDAIFYFFDLEGAPPTLTIADNPSAYRAGNVSTYLYYGDTSTNASAGSEFIRTFQKANRVSTRTAWLDAHDFTKPGTDLTAKATAADGLAASTRFEFDSALVPLLPRAHARAERQQVEHWTYFGSANGPDLRAGYTFTLTDQTGSGLGANYLVTSVQQAAFRRITNGVATYFYGNQFRVIPSTLTFRPELKTPRPVALPSSAIVTGAAGEEIHVDKYGRVKVQFHWDRYGSFDDKSSAWLRVATPWAGPARGMMFLPRVGDEVVVDFVQGDPDQPFVAGSLYNNDSPVPYALPGNKTKSTIKTASTPGGAGANEIMFDDAAGAEMLKITAQKDFTVSVGNDLLVTAAQNLSLNASQGIGINTPSDPAFALKVNGVLGADTIQSSSSSSLTIHSVLQQWAEMFMNDRDLHFRNDAYHGIGWYGDVKPFAGVLVNGPVVYGFSGGALGFKNFTTTNLVLTWNSAGQVGINSTNPVADLDVRDPAGYGGVLHVGSTATGGDPKLVQFGDGDYVHVGENGLDDRMELKAAQFFFTHSDGTGNVGIGTNNPAAALHVVGNILATGTITPSSDRNAKTDFALVDPAAVLESVSKLSIQQWRFKAEPEGVKHVGPMAQDFRAAFGLGENPTAIATVDADGVALAAIQGLNQRLEEKDAELQALKRQNESLELRLKALESRVSSSAH